MTVSKIWPMLKSMYYRNWKIPPAILDMIAVKDMLMDIAHGKSNSDVAALFHTGLDYIDFVCEEYYDGFKGWKETLDFSPLMVYNAFDGDYNEFVRSMQSNSNLEQEQINKAFNICRRYMAIERKILEYANYG